MLSKQSRLTPAELVYVREKGSFRPGEFFNLLAVNLADGRSSRVGVIVSRKTFSLATRRNRFRRTFYSGWQPVLNELADGWLFCGLGKKAGLEASPADFEREIRRLVNQIGSMKKLS